MHLILFEDKYVDNFAPLTVTRPAFDLRCGAQTLWQRHVEWAKAKTVSAIVRSGLAPVVRESRPTWSVNEPLADHAESFLLVNSRWLPPTDSVMNAGANMMAAVENEIAYAVFSSADEFMVFLNNEAQYLDAKRNRQDNVDVGGKLLRYPWDLVEANADAVIADAKTCDGGWSPFLFSHVETVGPSDQFLTNGTVHIEPYVVVDTRNGPVMIDDGAHIHSFSRLEGPCYIGCDSVILGAKIRGGTIGPQCRIGGEVECAVFHGYSNKYHDGFVGHSYIGEWVNLAAGTQTSDLRNDYGPIAVSINGQRIETGLHKVGAFIGDHTKTGLNTLINTGSTIGAFCNVLPTASYVPRDIPSFCDVRHGAIRERTDFREMLQTASFVLQRRGRIWTDAMTDTVYDSYEQSAHHREQVIRAREQKQWRRSA